MRTQFLDVKDRRTAKRHAPWAAKILKEQCGYRAFESLNDYDAAIRARRANRKRLAIFADVIEAADADPGL